MGSVENFARLFIAGPISLAASAIPPARGTPGRGRLDVCVIGAQPGLSTALPAGEWFQVTVLEAAKVGFGASGRNGGQIVSSYSRDIDVIERTVGKRGAVARRWPSKAGASSARRPLRYPVRPEGRRGVRRLHRKQMDHLRAGVTLRPQPIGDHGRRASARWWRPTLGGMLDERRPIHPLNLASAKRQWNHLAAEIYEQSPATRIERGASGGAYPQGKVKAKFIVVAGNAYGLVPELAAEVDALRHPGDHHRAAERRTGPQPAAAGLLEDCNYLLDYRLSGDKRLIYGGGVAMARDPDIEAIIRPKMLKTFPQLKDVKIDFAWTGNFLLTLSRLPQVGRIGDNIYYSQGCSGRRRPPRRRQGPGRSPARPGRALRRFRRPAALPLPRRQAVPRTVHRRLVLCATSSGSVRHPGCRFSIRASTFATDLRMTDQGRRSELPPTMLPPRVGGANFSRNSDQSISRRTPGSLPPNPPRCG